MKKLMLDLGALRVDSFAAAPDEAPARGTVRANSGLSPHITNNGCVFTTTDPNQQCMCYSSSPCVQTHETGCGPDCV
ncbi:MAG TPA: hypothetical protein VFQ39_14760 [Longimicrobium sp.]|nr:hypothetical protein [Longimicrobium sp.]